MVYTCHNMNLQELTLQCYFTWLIFSRYLCSCNFSINSMLECSKKMNTIFSVVFSETNISYLLLWSLLLFKWPWLKSVAKLPRHNHWLCNRMEFALLSALENSYGVSSLSAYHWDGSNSNSCNLMKSQWLKKKKRSQLKANSRVALLSTKLIRRKLKIPSIEVSKITMPKLNGDQIHF